MLSVPLTSCDDLVLSEVDNNLTFLYIISLISITILTSGYRLSLYETYLLELYDHNCEVAILPR